jgi:hypothetical protein
MPARIKLPDKDVPGTIRDRAYKHFSIEAPRRQQGLF